MTKGQLVWFAVPKVYETNLASDKRIMIFKARSMTDTFLKQEDTLKAYNNNLPLHMSAAGFLIGLSLMIWKPKKRLAEGWAFFHK